MELSFNVQGEFITQTAREWFYLEKRPFTKVKELLLSCMCGTNISKEILNQYVEDILKFKRKFIGNTKDNTFCLVDEIETNKLSKYYEELKKYRKLPFEICEYGFINPQGEYIPVQWCKHGEWANDYLKKNYSTKEWMHFMNNAKGEINNRTCCSSTDALVNQLNWILIDNPHQGKGIIQQGKRITKAQKETLYDYLIHFNRVEEANKLYKEK